ncbi:oxysterol binding protein 1 [Corynespora cassiicola Philippines]|uniref:Oxysterol binding protein 1 n=1 Tax=Corynespora cassiicola Philippines TaxID=1448308 RepID=A0A2T2P7L5_CORCC|nr:oxysterol binding protein 1 [Corynespora cassiicola Philippines]
MAGMEQLEVHSKSYLVRWVNVSAGHTISWSIQPHKKSINFGLFKHPGAASASLPSSTTFEDSGPSTPALEVPTTGRGRGGSTSRNDRTFVFEKLSASGLKQVHWVGKCEADKVTMGTWNVPEGEGGMYGLVFDNTFSKTVSKTATFVLMTYPTNAPPKSGHHMHYAQAKAGQSSTSLNKSSPGLGPVAVDSSESLPHTIGERPKSSYAQPAASTNSSFLTGVLHKKRRKRNQGYARRFFSLDFTSSTLSYYRNDHSSALRGAIPLSLAVIGANEKTREISVDSGAEVWQLRAGNMKDFEMWKDALDRASRSAGKSVPSPTLQIKDSPFNKPHTLSEVEEREWARVETLVSKIAGTRDAVRRLAQDTDPKYGSASGLGIAKLRDSLSPTPSEAEAADYFPDMEKGGDKKAFWKRKASSSAASPSGGMFRRSVSAQVAVGSPSTVPPVPPVPPNGNLSIPKANGRLSAAPSPQEGGIHDHCMELLRDLDSAVKDFSELIAESRQRRTPAPQSAVSSRRSFDSVESADEFFDAAEDGDPSKSQVVIIRRDSEDLDREQEQDQDVSDGESESSSENEGIGAFDRTRLSKDEQTSLFPQKPQSLTPLPLQPVKRRNNVPASKGQPPSLIGHMRKNVGKDLSTISMPVTSNEPISALQRVAEQMEYTELLDAAVNANPDTGERLVIMAAFAISYFSNSRAKERAIRKPFNPMLGETYELVREDKGFRFIAEKVCHRPVRMACQAESASWTLIQTPTPRQNFWGKSMELNTEGKMRVFLHTANEHYSWTIATSYLRNIIAGEKYVEPTGTMAIMSETSGAKAVCTFKAGGMFAGRSEDVAVQVFDSAGGILPMGAQGKWTTGLEFTSNGQPTGNMVWKVGPLVDKPQNHYGFTTFAATLNQITPIEDKHLPPTDSRLRPDQRAAEEGDMDSAEALKARLEERQRARRRVMEEHGEEWVPRWFSKVGPEEASALGDEEVWRLKGGNAGYWECRERGEWEGVVDVFEK